MKISEQAFAVGLRYSKLFDERKLKGINDELYLIENGKRTALNGVAGGQRNHKVVGHIVNRIRQRIEQVVGEHDPNDLNRLACLRNGEKQNACYRNERRRKQQPRTGFALLGAGTVNYVTHCNVCYRVYYFGNDGENDKECAAPYAREFENIGVIYVQICCQNGIQQQSTARSEQIAEPFFFCSDISRTNLRIKKA